jgi:serine/threonine protein phosphatase PrpC
MVAAQDLSTVPAVRRWAPGVASATAPWRAGDPCGDAALWLPLPPASDPGGLLAIVDGLGHGHEAALAAEAAVQALAAAVAAGSPQRADAPPQPPDLRACMQHMDAALCGLRGAAAGLMGLHGRRLWHAAVGNTRALHLRQGAAVRLPSQNGIVGGGMPAQLQVAVLDVLPGDWLLLFTDGLEERLGLPVELPEWQRDPALLCLHLLQRHRAARDDAGVLVARIGAA